MKNIVVCFDHTDQHPGRSDATNAKALFELLEGPDQPASYRSNAGAPGGRRLLPGHHGAVIDEARRAVEAAYRFVGEFWRPGDRIFLFGGADGGQRACELATLLGTVGLLPADADDLQQYALATYLLPRTARTHQDWRRVTRLAAHLLGENHTPVPVHFLGLWDALPIAGTRPVSGPLDNVESGRHAVAVDGGHKRLHHDGQVAEVWFRGAHCDVAGGAGACWPLADIALDWMLDSAVHAGLRVHERPSSPSDVDALAGASPTFGARRVPLDAGVHASVEIYLRSHPQYWRRLPARIEWADADWLARGERLMTAPASPWASVPAPATMFVAAAS
ncbi:phospholipase effector Tle1 domain-containing protein [Mycobacterium sp. NPDC003449]